MPQTKSLSPPTVAALVGESLQVIASPCREMALPDVISASLSLDAWTSIPVGCVSAFTRFFPGGFGLTFALRGSAREHNPATQLYAGSVLGAAGIP